MSIKPTWLEGDSCAQVHCLAAICHHKATLVHYISGTVCQWICIVTLLGGFSIEGWFCLHNALSMEAGKNAIVVWIPLMDFSASIVVSTLDPVVYASGNVLPTLVEILRTIPSAASSTVNNLSRHSLMARVLLLSFPWMLERNLKNEKSTVTIKVMTIINLNTNWLKSF